MIADVEAARQEAAQIMAECAAKRWAIGLGLLAVAIMLDKRGIPQPDDYLSWISGGKCSDRQIRDAAAVFG